MALINAVGRFGKNIKDYSIFIKERRVWDFAAIGFGGAVGALLRFETGCLATRLCPGFPAGILAVNVAGSFCMGLLAGPALHLVAPEWRISEGFLGALTTFSTFSMDTVNLFSGGRISVALLNIMLNLCLCLGGAALGYAL